MPTVFNTSHKVQTDAVSDAERLSYNVEEGAIVTTPEGVFVVQDGAWRKIYPHGGSDSGLGWARYDDSTYTSSNKLALALDTEVILPNDAGAIYRSHTGADYYNSSTQKVIADNENDTYLMTVVFKYSAPNANQTYLEMHFEGGNGTPYDRIRDTITFPKGNDTEHDHHAMFQYYADSNFVNNGSQWKITANGGTASVWDIIFFIQKVQSYA